MGRYKTPEFAKNQDLKGKAKLEEIKFIKRKEQKMVDDIKKGVVKK